MNFYEFTNRIGGRWAISYWQGLITLLIGFYASLNRVKNIFNLSNQDSLIFALIVSSGSAFAFVIVERFLLRNRFEVRQSFTKIFYCYSLIWLITVLVESYVTLYLFDATLYIGPQIIAPFAPTIFGLFTVAFIIGEINDSKAEQYRLAHLQRQFLQATTELEAELKHEQKTLLHGVRDLLLPKIAQMKEDFRFLSSGEDIAKKLELANEIEEYSNQTVRHLSHEINSAYKVGLDSESNIEPGQVALRDQIYPPVIGVKSVLFVTLVIGGFQELSTNGLAGFIFDLCLSAYIVFANYLGRFFLNKLSSYNLQVLWSAFIAHSALTMLGAFRLEKVLFPELPQFQFFADDLIAPLRLIIGSILASLLLTVAAGHRKTLEEIITTNQAIANQASARQNKILQIRTQLAGTLHGPIQGRLAGIAMLIRLEDSSENTPQNKASNIIDSLNDIEKDLHVIFDGQNLNSELDLLQETLVLENVWKNLVNIKFEIDEKLYCFSDTVILNSLRSILNESVTNAVRHGKANEILIRIKESTSASTKLEISIINNGISLEGAPKFGLGLNSISKVARSWNLKNLEDGRVGVLASL